MASGEGVERDGVEGDGVDLPAAVPEGLGEHAVAPAAVEPTAVGSRGRRSGGPVASPRADQLRALERRRQRWRVIADCGAADGAEGREASASAWLAGAEEALVSLGSRLDATSPVVVAERLRRLGAVAERVQATMAALAGSMDRSSQWAVEGATSPAAWLVGETSMGASAAKRTVGVGRLLTRFEVTRAAVADRSVSAAHAEVLAAAVLAKGRDRLFGRDEAVRLTAARQLPVEPFARVVRRWAHLADDELDNGEPAEAFERRGMSFASLPSGNVRVAGELDASAGALLLAAFASQDRPDPAAGDCPPRTIAQRRADFLGDLAQLVLRQRNAEGHAPVATVDVIVDVERLDRLCGCPAHRRAEVADHRGARADSTDGVDPAGRIDDAGRTDTAERAGPAELGRPVEPAGTAGIAETGVGSRAGGPGPGHHVGDCGAGGTDGGASDPARWADAQASGPLPVHVLEQLLCDCWVGRIALRGGSEVLDAGRRTRTWSPAQRRAIIARDRHCTHPGCTRGPAWCDIHHVDDWNEGGRTDVDNGTLRCRWHHTWHHLHHRRRSRAPT